MPDLVPFPNATAHLSLPLLIPGQAQKEFFVNQALAILDGLYARVVSASLSSPPATAAEGQCYRINADASQEWQGRSDQIAMRIGDGWHFVTPREGMAVFDETAGQSLVFRAGWQSAVAPPAPTGGPTVDAEARAAIAQLIASLQAVGVLAAPEA
jgi:hypothetical protein